MRQRSDIVLTGQRLSPLQELLSFITVLVGWHDISKLSLAFSYSSGDSNLWVWTFIV